MSNVALWILVLFETVLLLLLLRALGELRQKGALIPGQPTQSSALGGLEIGEQAPSFTAIDQDGNKVRLEDFKGHRCILAFVSPGCPACVDAIKALSTILESEQDLAVLVVGGTDRDQNQAYATTHHAKMPILTPEPSFDQSLFRIQVVPFIFVLDEIGVVRAKNLVSRYEALQALLAEAFPPVPVSRGIVLTEQH